ncbi:unnamed protein product [Calicophoron daubneyi]|uniref:MARVEL domain-containing protein n=1 Tax=Calicophoron daubneyi TaxID=300641 RepID=A0AAV2THT2_CALDB
MDSERPKSPYIANACAESPLSNDRNTKRKLKYYENYVRTFPGIIRMLELAFMLVAFFLSSADKTSLSKGGSWLVVTTLLSLFVSFFFLLFHLFLAHRFWVAPWALIEFGVGVIICVFLFSGGVLSAAYSHHGASMIALTVILFLALAVYIVDGLIAFKILMAGRYYE